MTSLRSLLVVASLVALSSPAAAYRPGGARSSPPDLELASGSPARAHRQISWDVPAGLARDWARFLAVEGAGWRASWDLATGVPSRIFGAGVPAPGAMTSDALAELHARAALGRHIGLLAPGASPDDFVVVANHLGGGLRTVGLAQRHGGLPVLGGQVSFRFKNDRLFVIGSEALPRVQAPAAVTPISDARAQGAAVAWIAAEATGVKAGAVDAPAILPIVRATGVEYRTVRALRVDAARPVGAWTVYVDAATAAPVARRSLLRWADGTVYYDAPVRHPLSARQDWPAYHAGVQVNGASAQTTAVGVVTWTGTAAASLTTTVAGPYGRVLNDAGAEISGSFTLDPGGSVTWSGASVEFDDAQVSTFTFIGRAKTWARLQAPDLPWLDGVLQATVNYNDVCNAFSDGDTITLFREGSGCANTGRLADVVFHEFGHSFHAQSIIPGVGQFESALGEGVADYTASTIVNDPKMGRGFFLDDSPLREIDEPDLRWPEDVGGEDYYRTGTIFSGAMWDLRDLLVLDQGYETGVATADRLFYEGVRRSVDVPSTYVEILAADDDNGNLDDGTPNFCLILEAFDRHGLAPAGSGPGVQRPERDGWNINVQVTNTVTCISVTAAQVQWRLRSDPAVTGTVDMAATGDLWTGVIPTQVAGQVVQYQVTVSLGSGTVVTYPDNAADPWYEFFVGTVVELYCTDFETDPATDGWTHGLTAGEVTPGADDWQWGSSAAVAGSGDPTLAYSGVSVLGNDLGGLWGEDQYNGLYQADKTNYALSPAIDTQGMSMVRLQYRRWLNVEDSLYDHASIYANETRVWGNLETQAGSTHHADREWRFHDVDVTEQVVDGQVQIRFELDSDPGLEMGGWTLDDFCVVGWVPGNCGDGVLDPDEECDDGNDVDGDGCSSSCLLPRCGDGTVDPAEQCDDGNTADGDGCSAACLLPPGSCGDGVIDIGETCDDGNRVDDDDCDNACQPNATDGGEPDNCGCQVNGRGGAAGPLGLLLAAALLAVARRRRAW